ncbi:MAG: PAS domain S-box protein [Theionarchaea archaeon]|nr:PAS domain S-box protein [Theionarchaea archaeon]
MTKILVVEDEWIVARDIRKRLEKMGYTVSAVVSSGKEALQQINRIKPDIILMDIVIKGSMDGIKVAEKIHDSLDIPVIYLTAYADEEILQRAKETEPYGYILKPFEDRELHTAIEMALYKHKMEKKLKESEQWLATTLRSMGDGIITTNTEGIITFMNPVAETLTGWTEEEAIGTPLGRVFNVTDEEGEHNEGLESQAVQKGSFKGVSNRRVLISKKGTKIPIHDSATSIRDQQPVLGTVLIFRDITNERRMEQELLDSEEKYKHIAENSIDGVGMAQDGKIIYINDAYCTMFGYRRDELMGESLLKVVSPEDRPLIEERARKRIKGEKVPNSYEFIGMKKDGTRLFVEVSSSEAFVYRNKSTIFSILRDITERKQGEMQLKNVYEASRLITSTIDVERIFEFISESIQKLVGFDNFIIYLCSKTEKLNPVYFRGNITDEVKNQEVDYGKGLIGHSVTTGESMLVEDLHTQEDSRIHVPDVRSVVIIPLVTEDECIGALHISKSTPYSYHARDVAVANLLSGVISSAIRNSQLHNEIREFGLELEKRIEERSKKIEILLNTRLNLQTERSWEKGLTTIVDTTSTLGFEQVGVFLTNPMRNTLDFHYGKGVGLPKANTTLSLKNTEYFGVKCVLEKKTLFVKDASQDEGNQVTESRSFVWVPIVVQDEAFAAIAAGNVSRTVTEEDVKDLEILASMCATFIDRTRVSIEPVAEKQLRTEFKYSLNPLEGYIVLERKPEKSFKIFVDLVTHGIPGFVISRVYPEKVKRKYNLVKTPIVWLSRTERKNAINPDDLSKLRYIIEDFTKKSEESVVLLDGLEYLTTQTSFETVLKYLQELKDTVVLNNSRLIISLHRETLTSREYSTLEREFTILEMD